MKFLFGALVFLSFSTPALAHEGHASHGPTGVKANQGGIVKAGKHLALEIVAHGSDVKVYPMATDGKSIPLTDVTLKATAQAPKKPKTPIQFAPMSDHFLGKIEMKGSYRYELQLDASTKGKSEKFVFQIEPQG